MQSPVANALYDGFSLKLGTLKKEHQRYENCNKVREHITERAMAWKKRCQEDGANERHEKGVETFHRAVWDEFFKRCKQQYGFLKIAPREVPW
ncbi:hypothetical protein AA106555_1007 [Neokomagataea thailandica NBRC 106555]|uniref:Uncharacterized protein n=1 Tax=Neokomagataea thailandica NBRC 106555 TaxID=1223520 RepID=A0ABQ0QPU3_9PROT|nr:hypothetical protein AA106555_1007 [Neokomagataea thailandica NBRC 106555]